MKTVLQLFPMTIITTRLDCKHVALLSPTCVVAVNPPHHHHHPETQKHTCFSVSVCEGGSALSAPVATLPPVSQDRMKHVLPTPPGSLRGAGGRSVRFAFVRLLIGVSHLSLCWNPTSQVTSPFEGGVLKEEGMGGV